VLRILLNKHSQPETGKGMLAEIDLVNQADETHLNSVLHCRLDKIRFFPHRQHLLTTSLMTSTEI
jgi:hypothetical protein